MIQQDRSDSHLSSVEPNSQKETDSANNGKNGPPEFENSVFGIRVVEQQYPEGEQGDSASNNGKEAGHPGHELNQQSEEQAKSKGQPEREPNGFVGVDESLAIVESSIVDELFPNLLILGEAVVAIAGCISLNSYCRLVQFRTFRRLRKRVLRRAGTSSLLRSQLGTS